MKHKRISRINFKYIIIVLLIIFNIIFFVSILGRYVGNGIKDFYSRSKEFYFYSDKLGENNPQYQIEGWSGVDDYTITIKMNSFKNNLLNTSYDITYDVSFTVSDNAICQLSKENGIISSNTNTDYFTLTITPNAMLETGDEVCVEVTAKAKHPYEKTIKGKFVLVVGKEKLTYVIEDSQNAPYLEVDITNTLSYYNIQEAFDSYRIGDRITRATFLSLDNEKKDKCYSSIVTIRFNPDEILLDMTSDTYQNAVSISEISKNGNTYINSISFKVDAISSKKIRFYKVDRTNDYTYPKNNNEPIITLTSI